MLNWPLGHAKFPRITAAVTEPGREVMQKSVLWWIKMQRCHFSRINYEFLLFNLPYRLMPRIILPPVRSALAVC